MLCSAGIDFLLRHGTKRKTKNRSTLRVWLANYLPPMALNNSARDRQANPHTASLCRNKGLKKLRHHFRSDSCARVGYADGNHVIVGGGGGDRQFASLAPLHRFDRIAHQVQQDLLNLYFVDEYKIDGRIEREFHANSMVLGADERERACFLHEFRNALYSAFSFTARDEIP